MKINLLKLSLGLLCAFSFEHVSAQWTGPKSKPLSHTDVRYGSLVPKNRTDEAMVNFRKYGLGQFIHWGVYALTGEGIPNWNSPKSSKEMQQLYKKFNPQDFKPRLWARQAKEMGVRYLIFTTKHHDGFSMWPTKYSDFSIASTPYKKDIVKEIVDAYDAEGIAVFLYFSVLEWNNPNYMSKVPETKAEKDKYNLFLQYTKNQLFELLDNYPTIKGFWFDGTWDPSWIKSYDFAYNLEKDLRQKHPGLIIGSRFRSDEHGKRHFDSNGVLLGDYEQGWERKLPQKFEWLEGNDWDAAMTILPNGWGYTKDIKGQYRKTTDDILDMLMHAISMNGNFVLNFGPDGNGNIPTEEANIAREVGEWIKVNGEAVYAVRHADLPTSKIGYFTQRDRNLYLTVFNRPLNNIIRISIPKKEKLVPVTAVLLVNGQSIPLKHSDLGLDLDQQTYYDLTLPTDFNSTKPFVVKMELKAVTPQTTQLMDAQM